MNNINKCLLNLVNSLLLSNIINPLLKNMYFHIYCLPLPLKVIDHYERNEKPQQLKIKNKYINKINNLEDN